MFHYKTVVTDYEGMQEALAVYGEQGWRLISVTPDTWRVVTGKLGDGDSLGLSGSLPAASGNGAPPHEYSASYYLLVFQREDDPALSRSHEVAAEALEYPDFSLPEF